VAKDSFKHRHTSSVGARMKTSEALLLIGGVGATAYFLFSKGYTSPRQTYYVDSPPPQDNTPVAVSARYPNDVVVTKNISSTREGVNFINDTVAAGGTLQRTSGTIQKVGYNSNVARLADGSVALVTVKTPSDGGILSRIKTARGGGRMTHAQLGY
jgi:hypothetical protein